MKKGFTKKERVELEIKIGAAQSAIELLVEFMREKHELADDWMSERSELWFEGESCESFETWINELDFKIDEIDNLKDEIDIDSFDDII